MQNVSSYKTLQIKQALQAVKDPEIPVISVLDLGIISKVHFSETNAKATVYMTPTFTGCPAIDLMRQQINDCVANIEFVKEVEVLVDFSKPWSSDLISEQGKQQIKEFGLAPPQKNVDDADLLNALAHTACPRCGGNNTQMESPFGPTLCRSIHYCNDCQQAFQGFKPV